MTDSRITIPGQNVSFVLTPPWELRPPWDDPAVQQELGVYVAISETTFCLHVRAGPELPFYPSTSEGIERYLFDQGWASAPFDISRWSAHEVVGVAGTFRTTHDGELVREWYLTDGQRVADCAATAPAVELSKWLPECERIVRSIRFTTAA